MQSVRQASWGMLVALASTAILAGGLSLSLLEGDMPVPTQVPASPTPSLTPSIPTTTSTPTHTAIPNETATPTPTPTECLPPTGWAPITVLPGDSLDSLAALHKMTAQTLKAGNCLESDILVPGTALFVPPGPRPTAIPCGAPAGWITYTIQKGDTLYGLAQYYGITVGQLQRANCMGSSTLLVAGKKMVVPPGPTRTPLWTATPFPSETATPVEPPPSEPPPSETPTDTPAP